MKKFFERLLQNVFDLFFSVLFFLFPSRWLERPLVLFPAVTARFMDWVCRKKMPPEDREKWSGRKAGRTEGWVRAVVELWVEEKWKDEDEHKKTGKEKSKHEKDKSVFYVHH